MADRCGTATIPQAVLANKATHLRAIIDDLASVAVAYSGGTDSAYLLAICLDVLGTDQVLGLTADSPLMPRAELEAARLLAAQLGVRHRVLESDDLANPAIAANPADRCYHCKRARFEALGQVAESEGMAHLVHGENADDFADYRPGSRAAEELGVRAPLSDAGLTKVEVRTLSRQRGLATWDRPANACLASRFPYGTPLTPEGLARVEAAEAALHNALNLRQLRVRDHYPVARLEVSPHEIARLAQPGVRTVATELLCAAGYCYVALDLTGYRMGSLNDVLEPERRP
jgi:uncharacterized protein